MILGILGTLGMILLVLFIIGVVLVIVAYKAIANLYKKFMGKQDYRHNNNPWNR